MLSGIFFWWAVVSYLAYLSHIPESYIFAIDVIMLGIGVVTGIENAHQKEPDFWQKHSRY